MTNYPSLAFLVRPLTILLVGLAVAHHALSAGTTGAVVDNGLPLLGELQSRSAREIEASTWSIGGETLDRDYAVYENYKHYLGALGAKGIRLQAGWAKCEREIGVYTWAWLDAIVDDAIAQGVRPWLQISYGNTLYEGGGDSGLGGGLPSSPEAVEAWIRWTDALVARYKNRVHEWEIWNEPDINRTGQAKAESYAGLFIRTVEAIRKQQPESRILALSLAGKMDYADQFLALLQAEGKLDLVDAITIHGYPRNPDDLSNIESLQKVIEKYGQPIEVRQGETGAPSRFQEFAALSKIAWTENLQAKWNLRRMLAHHAQGIPFNLFTMSDMHYTRSHREPGEALRMNTKGLLATNPDKTISHAKVAYRAAQHVFTIFDHALKPLSDYPFTTTSLRRLAVTGYRHAGENRQVVALWFNDAPPADANGVTHVDVTLVAGRFVDPVLVDLLTGRVHALPAGGWNQDEKGTTFTALPVYDAPVLIAERSAIAFIPPQP